MAATIQQIMIAAASAGKLTADGADGMMHLAKIVYGGAREGSIVGGKQGNVKDVYKAYLGAATKSEYGSKVKLDNDAALKFGVSKLTAFVKFATLSGKTDANWNLVRNAVRVVNEDANAKDGGERKVVSRYEQVLKVVRYAVAVKKPKLDDATIREALAPKDPVGDLELKAMERLLRAAQTAQEGARADKTGFFAAIAAEIEAQVEAYKKAFPTDAAIPGLDADDDTSLEDFLGEVDPTLQAAA